MAADELLLLNMDELKELKELNSKTIKDLESDISILKQQISQYRPDFTSKASHTIIQRQDGSTNASDVKLSLESDIKNLQNLLYCTEKITDIRIEKMNWKVLNLDNIQCKKRYDVEMKILDRPVNVTFDLLKPIQPQSGGEDCGKVTWFEFSYEEYINLAMGEAVQAAAESHNFHGVFSLIKSYLQWYAQRKKILRSMSESYPDFVSIKSSEEDDSVVMILSNPNPSHPKFCLTFGKKIVQTQVEDSITLDIQNSDNYKAHDTSGVLSAAPAMWTSMKDQFGAESALTSLAIMVGEGRMELPQGGAT